MHRWSAVATVLLAAASSLGALAAASGTAYLGSWTARMSKAQMINAGLDPRLAGTFRLVLTRSGAYKSFNSFDGSSSGSFTASGRRIVFSNDIGCKQGGIDKKGVYTWSIANGRLRFTTARIGGDPCGGRWQTLTYPIWTRK